MPGREPDPPPTVDLHGLRPEQALKRVALELHAVRVRRGSRLVVVTGRGHGNPEQRPLLRKRVEAWLRGAEGRSLGVVDVRVVAKGGALDVRLRPPGT